MRILHEAILRDLARIVDRHPDLTTEFKTRLLQGLDAIDAELVELRELVASRKPAETDAKRGKR